MTVHFNYELASVEDIAIYFEKVSRQTVASVRKNNEGTPLGEKLEGAFKLMKARKHERKMGELRQA